jgi:hypothetical protein
MGSFVDDEVKLLFRLRQDLLEKKEKTKEEEREPEEEFRLVNMVEVGRNYDWYSLDNSDLLN